MKEDTSQCQQLATPFVTSLKHINSTNFKGVFQLVTMQLMYALINSFGNRCYISFDYLSH